MVEERRGGGEQSRAEQRRREEVETMAGEELTCEAGQQLPEGGDEDSSDR